MDYRRNVFITQLRTLFKNSFFFPNIFVVINCKRALFEMLKVMFKNPCLGLRCGNRCDLNKIFISLSMCNLEWYTIRILNAYNARRTSKQQQKFWEVFHDQQIKTNMRITKTKQLKWLLPFILFRRSYKP